MGNLGKKGWELTKATWVLFQLSSRATGRSNLILPRHVHHGSWKLFSFWVVIFFFSGRFWVTKGWGWDAGGDKQGERNPSLPKPDLTVIRTATSRQVTTT